jgi:hypothetical protein
LGAGGRRFESCHPDINRIIGSFHQRYEPFLSGPVALKKQTFGLSFFEGARKINKSNAFGSFGTQLEKLIIKGRLFF